jgi:hypothetical protein
MKYENSKSIASWADIKKTGSLQVMSKPNGRVGAFAELSNDLVAAIFEGAAENDRMITTWVVVLHPLTR